MFKDEFESAKKKDLDMLVKLAKDCTIANPHELMMNAKIIKHVECRYGYFWFSDYSNVQHTPNDVMVSMLYNIENRISIFSGS